MLTLKEKDIIVKIGKNPDGVKKNIEENTFYRINTIVGATVFYDKYYGTRLLEEDTKGILTDLEDDTIYALTPNAIVFSTIYKGQ